MSSFAAEALLLSVLAAAACLFPSISGALSCRDENGDPVDWFVAYKLPHVKNHPNPSIRKGIGYFYMDANRPAFALSRRNLTRTDHAVAHTLAGVYDHADDPDVGYALYNDQIPGGGYSVTFGHTKGALALDDESGWWMIHSLPHFPPKAEDGYSLPSNALYFGQTFMCLSLASDEFAAVGDHLLYTYPWAYDFRVPDWLAARFPSLDAATRGEYVKKAPFVHVGAVETRAGVSFQTYGKSGKWGKDLYHDLVAPSLRVPLNVETWRRNAKAVLPSNCSEPFPVYNVAYLDFETEPYDTRFSYQDDHAKWAISRPAGDDVTGDDVTGDEVTGGDVTGDLTENASRVGGRWICIGGINRESTQFRRGGGTVCTMKPQIWAEFDRIVAKTEPCP